MKSRVADQISRAQCEWMCTVLIAVHPIGLTNLFMLPVNQRFHSLPLSCTPFFILYVWSIFALDFCRHSAKKWQLQNLLQPHNLRAIHKWQFDVQEVNALSKWTQIEKEAQVARKWPNWIYRLIVWTHPLSEEHEKAIGCT